MIHFRLFFHPKQIKNASTLYEGTEKVPSGNCGQFILFYEKNDYVLELVVYNGIGFQWMFG